MNSEFASEALKATPPVTVTATALAGGVNLNNVVLIATVFYILLQAGYLLWKWRRDWIRERRGKWREGAE